MSFISGYIFPVLHWLQSAVTTEHIYQICAASAAIVLLSHTGGTRPWSAPAGYRASIRNYNTQ